MMVLALCAGCLTGNYWISEAVRNPIKSSFPWAELIQGNRGVISLVGAGGKTTLMFTLAGWISACGKRVLTTTTTKIFMPTASQTRAVVLSQTPDHLLSEAEGQLRRHGHITVGAGYITGSNKIRGFTPEMIACVWRSGIADWILIEADGAAGRLLKAPAPHEPVIPSVSHYVVGVVGLGAIGKPLDDTYVFRTGPFAAVTKLLPGETVTASAVADLILHEEGIMRGAPAGSDRVLFLNKAEHEELQEAGEEVARLLQEKGCGGLRGLFIGSASEEPTGWEWWDFRTSR